MLVRATPRRTESYCWGRVRRAGRGWFVCVRARARARVHLDEVKTDAWLVRKLQVKQKSRLADDWICRFI